MGYPFSAWTLERLREHLARQTHIVLSSHYLSQLMAKHNIGYRCPKHSMEHLRDPQEYDEKKAFLEFVKKGAPRSTAAFNLLNLDECDIHLPPTLTRVWTLRDLVAVAAADQHDRWNGDEDPH